MTPTARRSRVSIRQPHGCAGASDWSRVGTWVRWVPDLLLKLTIYEHSQGRPQPVQWMKDLEENKAVQWLVYGMRPSQTTLYEFRDRVQPLVQDLNQQVIRTAIDQGHTTDSRGALDGTTVAANAMRHRMVNLECPEGKPLTQRLFVASNVSRVRLPSGPMLK
jgi:hypothetical protein